MNIAAIVFVVLVIAFQPAFANAQVKNADIVGIKIGMSPEQVRAALKTFDPNIKITENRWTAVPGVPSSLARFVAWTNADKCPNYSPGSVGSCPLPVGQDRQENVFAIYFTQLSGKVFYVYRAWAPWDLKTSSKVAATSVEEKYGPATHPGKTNGIGSSYAFLWAYNKNGEPLKEPGSCPPAFEELAPTGVDPNCGFRLQVAIGTGGPRRQVPAGIMNELKIAMYDARLQVEDIMQRESARTAAEAAQLKANEKAATQKPTL